MAGYYGLFLGEDAPELARALGDMILAWTNAEERQAFAFAAMLDLNPDTAIVLYQKFSNFRSRTQSLYSLIDLHPDYEPCRKPIEKISGLSMTRNRYVHCTYLQDEDNPQDIRSVDYSQIENTPKRSLPVKAADIKNHAKAVLIKADELKDALWGIPQYKVWLETYLPNWMPDQDHPDTQP
ncbi:hypothetical protein IM511_05075 [Erythrobacteraceae bacterium E2-1 Yellow Sea]|nr:hypothetical protein [Erythrobacteraceae bacterium E2-1 Yellow Sea]